MILVVVGSICPQLCKFNQNPKIFYNINFCDAFTKNWKVNIFTTLLIKSWSYQFLKLIDLSGIKKLLLHPKKLESP